MENMKIPKGVNPFTEPEKVAEFNEKYPKNEIKVIASQVTLSCDDETTATRLRALGMKDPLGNPMKVEVREQWHPTEPTTILSKAIEQVEQMGDYKVMVALVDLRKDGKPLKKDERVYTFTDIESKKLRQVIYKEIEKES